MYDFYNQPLSKINRLQPIREFAFAVIRARLLHRCPFLPLQDESAGNSVLPQWLYSQLRPAVRSGLGEVARCAPPNGTRSWGYQQDAFIDSRSAHGLSPENQASA
jgi:hypothetical protein